MDKGIENAVKGFSEKNLNRRIVPGKDYIPASGKVFDEKELLLGIEAVLDGFWTYGRFARQFEERLAAFVGCRKAILCNSGSSANLLAFSALLSPFLDKRLKKGTEVITTAACFPTTVNPIITSGCTPVFVDVEPGTYNAAPEAVEEAITGKTSAISLTHTLGNPFEAGKIKKIAEENGLFLLEDCCDALGSTFNGKQAGSFGDAASFSFYPAHHITMGEGGAVAVNSGELARAVKSIRDWGRDCHCETGMDNACGKRFGQKLGKLPFGYDHKYVYSNLGYNLKGTDLEAAIGLAQLEKLPFFIKKRRENFETALGLFKEFEDVFIMPESLQKAEPSWFGFPLTLRPDSGISRHELVTFLEKNKIGTRLLFCGNVTRQPYFIDGGFDCRISGSLENTDLITENTFWFGIFPALSREHFEYIHSAVETFLKRKK